MFKELIYCGLQDRSKYCGLQSVTPKKKPDKTAAESFLRENDSARRKQTQNQLFKEDFWQHVSSLSSFDKIANIKQLVGVKDKWTFTCHI